AGAPYEIDHPRLAGLVQPPAAPNGEKPGSVGPDAKPEGTKPEGAGRETKPETKHDGADMSSPGAVVVATTGEVTGDSGHPESEHGAPASPQVAGAADPAPAPQADPTPPPKGEDVLQRPGQLSLFVSRREGKLFVRKGFTPAFDVPIKIAQPEK